MKTLKYRKMCLMMKLHLRVITEWFDEYENLVQFHEKVFVPS